MISAFMLYTIAVTFLFALAATAAERLLRLAGREARAVWIVAMVAAVIVAGIRGSSIFVPASPLRVAERAVPSLSSKVAAPTFATSPLAAPAVAPIQRTPSRLGALIERVSTARIEIASDSAVIRFDRALATAWAALCALGL